eukprot:CAMPEP_0177585978 /NCGR_PEP_ID=MMETSP0419_2-20121207/4807_1 /TAXON_ID=582737 /ORGANISM="Tetraselmis sp., Strain GSL018" /LENGTH=569 /DNA_ID=CAMNT_0019075799 /DNA_START=194 /DNA_END=1899 /DNA_ORIENTATION=+
MAQDLQLVFSIFNLVLMNTCRSDIAKFRVGDGEFSCLPQRLSDLSTKYPPSLSGGDLDIVVLVVSPTTCASNDRGNAAVILGAPDVDGKAVAFELCNGTSRDEYWADYYQKSLELERRGAALLLAAEPYPAKLPEHMDDELTRTLRTPVCIMDQIMFRNIRKAADEAGGTAKGSFSGLPFYRVDDEPDIDTPITGITITAAGSEELSLEIPAGTSTFNPETFPGFEGSLISVRLREDCYNYPSEDWAACVRCWSTDRVANEGGPFENFEEIAGAGTLALPKVLFIPLESDGNTTGKLKTCFSYYYHWAVIADRLLADGAIIGGLRENSLTVAGPYLVGNKVVPAFSTIRMHSRTISQLLTDKGGVNVRLPELTDRQGPPYYASSDVRLGLTSIRVWEDSDDWQDRHFVCIAGQALYNPKTHLGAPAPEFDEDGGLVNGTFKPVVHVRPSAACSDISSCAECLTASSPKLQLDGGSYANRVVLLEEADFPCFHKHTEFSQAAMEAAPFALLVGIAADMTPTISDLNGELAEARLPFPTFTLDSTCGQRIVAGCGDSGLTCQRSIAVQLPP